MRCPTDGAELVMAERQGVEIDYCPSCRGIWLDRGELDKILDRAAGAPDVAAERGFGGYPAPAPSRGDEAHRGGGYPDPGYRDAGYPDPGYREGGYRDDRYVRRDDDRRQPYGKKKRRESWLGDLLDFD